MKEKLQETIDNLLKDKKTSNEEKSLSLIDLAELAYLSGDINSYIVITNELLKLNPDFKKSLDFSIDPKKVNKRLPDID